MKPEMTPDGYISNLLLFNKTASMSENRSYNALTAKDAHLINYKNVALLKKYVTHRGRIIPRRITGLSSDVHKKLVKQIKIARILGFLAFCSYSA